MRSAYAASAAACHLSRPSASFTPAKAQARAAADFKSGAAILSLLM